MNKKLSIAHGLGVVLSAGFLVGGCNTNDDTSGPATRPQRVQKEAKHHAPSAALSGLGAEPGLGVGFDVEHRRASATLLDSGVDVQIDETASVTIAPTPTQNLKGEQTSETWHFDVAAPSIRRQKASIAPSYRDSKVTHREVRAQYSDGLTVAYRRDPAGFEQRFVLRQKPAGSSALRLAFDLPESFRATAHPKDGYLTITHDQKPVLGWHELHVIDADGKPVSARFFNTKRAYGIEISDGDAAYPLYVDPVLFSPDAELDAGDDAGEEAQYAYSVHGVGDLDGDSFDDVVIGERKYSNGESLEGRFLVFRGSQTGLRNTANVAIESDASIAGLGHESARLGDIDGDGYADVVVSAPFAASNAGQLHVYNGRNGTTSDPAVIDTANPTVITGNSGAKLGWALASGDVDCDGNTDLIGGGPGASMGEFEIYFGTSGSFETTPTTITGAQIDEQLGFDVAVGNINGDTAGGNQCDDILVSAPYWDADFGDESGRVAVYAGNSSRTYDETDWEFKGAQASSFHGLSVEASDLDADGFADIIFGANLYDGNVGGDSGRVLIFGGQTNFADIDVDANDARFIQEGFSAGERFGSYLNSAGDLNNDGFNDLIVGAFQHTGAVNNEGAAYVFLSTSDGLLQDQYQWRRIGTDEGLGEDARFGRSVDGAGDVNNDGFDDFIVGAYQADVTDSGGATISKAGKAFSYLGDATCFADGQFWNDGESNPNNTCQVCDASQGSVVGWSNVANSPEESCDDGDGCTESDVCVDGVCEGTPKDCSLDPVQACSEGYCDPSDGQCKSRGVDTSVQCAPASCASETQAVPASFCDGDANNDNTGVCLDAVTQDCSPFKCSAGACLTSCSDDDDCMSGAYCDTSDSTCTTANRRPTADAGPDLVVNVGDSVTLDGSASSDPDGDELDYTWTQQGGEAATLSDDDTATPNFEAPEPADGDELLTFQLVVNDGQQDSQPDTMTVLVRTQSNAKPTAAISGPTTATAGEAITLSGQNSSDPDGDDLTYSWSRTGGRPLPILGDTSDEQLEITFPGDLDSEETYSFLLVVNDGNVNSDPALREVTVTPTPGNPDVGPDAGPDAGPNPGADAGVDGGDTDVIDIDDRDASGSSCSCDNVDHDTPTSPGWLFGMVFLGGLAWWRRRKWLD